MRQSPKTSLLMSGVLRRLIAAVAVIAVLWLAVAWAVRDAA